MTLHAGSCNGADCWLCFKAETDERYFKLWNPDKTFPVPKDLDCLNRGAALEEAACPTCKNGTRIKTFSCSVHGLCTYATKVEGAKTCAGCRERRVLAPERTVVVGLPGLAFNPSIIRWRDRWLMAYRDERWGSRLWIAPLGEDFRLSGRPVRLTLNHPLCASGQEDPRLFVFQDRLHVIFSAVEVKGGATGVTPLFARLADDFRVEAIWEPLYAQRKHWEKNWGPFEVDGQLHVVYRPWPQTILRAEGTVMRRAHTSVWPSRWRHGEMRGGAAPVRHGDEFYSFFHSWLPERHACVMGVYTFGAAPPFEPKRLCATPIVSGRDWVVFPCGAAHQEGKWLVSYGVDDKRCEVAVYDDADLEGALCAI